MKAWITKNPWLAVLAVAGVAGVAAVIVNKKTGLVSKALSHVPGLKALA